MELYRYLCVTVYESKRCLVCLQGFLGKERYVRLNEWKTRRSVYQICVTNCLLPLDKSIHYRMIVKDNGKGQV